jgi:hypothetical protein
MKFIELTSLARFFHSILDRILSLFNARRSGPILTQGQDTMAVPKTIYFGPFVHSESPSKLDICLTGAIGVEPSGKIAFVRRDVDDPSAFKEPGWEDAHTVKIGKLDFFFPGFIGTLSFPH